MQPQHTSLWQLLKNDSRSSSIPQPCLQGCRNDSPCLERTVNAFVHLCITKPVVTLNHISLNYWLACFPHTIHFSCHVAEAELTLQGPLSCSTCSIRFFWGHLKHHICLSQSENGPLVSCNDVECCEQLTRTIAVIG